MGSLASPPARSSVLLFQHRIPPLAAEIVARRSPANGRLPSMPSETTSVTELLAAWRDGDQAAEDALVGLLYDELKRIAVAQLACERPDHTLSPTALVHEAYLRLAAYRRKEWRDRSHFLAAAAIAMRRVLLDHARRRRAQRRGAGRTRIDLHDAADLATGPVDVLDLEDTLGRLARLDPVKAKVVQLRFYGGLTLDETAAVLGCGSATVVRHWRLARAWLFRELWQRSEE